MPDNQPVEHPKRIQWTPGQKKELNEIGERIKAILDSMPLPKKPTYLPKILDILKIWDEDI